MAVILVAEDSRTQAAGLQFMLEESGHTVRIAKDGDEALAAIMSDPPEIVLTDMHMPGKNGLELTEAVRKSFPDIPVILITADGSEELAVEALRKGASSYISKRQLERDLISTVGDIAKILESRKTRSHVMKALTHSEATFVFGNDRDFATSLVAHMEAELRSLNFDDETGLFRIVMALKEAIINAIDHGNLELDSVMRDEGDGSQFYTLGDERMNQRPYRDRTVSFTSRVSPEQLSYIVRDGGPGFDPSRLPDPADPENVLRAHGRGLLLIRSFLDDVSFNESGNEITMVKYLKPATSSQTSADKPWTESDDRTMRILLVDDSQTNQVLGRSILEKEGHHVTVAANGIEAVEMSAAEQFDLILMDLEMPELDGFEATAEIRRREQSTGHQTPIIAMTGHDGADDHARCLSAGMAGFLSKPITAEELRNALTTLSQAAPPSTE